MDKYIYQPKAGILIGLPAKDMTDAEWQKYPKGLRKTALDLGMFEIDSPQEGEKEVKNAKRS